jgi:hypothetical protein
MRQVDRPHFSIQQDEYTMATAGVKFETLTSSGFPEPNRFRLKVYKVGWHPATSQSTPMRARGYTSCTTVPLRSHSEPR